MLKAIQWILLIYGVLAGLYYTYQQHVYFHPKPIDGKEAYVFANDLEFSQTKLPFDSATNIEVVQFFPKDSIPKGVVLFFHGNKENVNHYSNYAPYFTGKGYECWMPDYPGFGRSTGELSVDMLEKLALQLYKLARTKYASQQIVIYGKSIGTGIAAYLAASKDCRDVMLEAPYYSLASLTADYLFFLPVNQLIKYDIDTYKHVSNIAAPITIVIGDKDELIPVTNAAGLLKHLKETDAFYLIPGGDHNNLPAQPLYHAVLDSVMSH